MSAGPSTPTADRTHPQAGPALQPSFESMGTSLSQVTFVVVDLETTGAGPGAHAITEISAVRVRGGEVLDEMSTLVQPGVAIPAHITMLTGITNAMVAQAPEVDEALDTFLSWACLDRPDTVLVAHNARFDVGHLKGAAEAVGAAWPGPRVLDTLALARRAWPRSVVPNHRLSTLARFVGARTTPTHRALDDARATVDVLHAALEVLGPLGVTHLEDLATATDPVPPRRRAKARLAEPLPTTPGVYQFLSPASQVLYVGSAANLRRRVRSYFTAAEKRRHVAQMLDTTVSVRVIECPTEIEARVRELRLIAELDPPVNRRSRAPQRQPWIHLATSRSAGARLATTTVLPWEEVGCAVGPFPSRSAAGKALRAAESVLRLEAWDPRGGASQPGARLPASADLVRRALGGEIDLIAGPVLETIRALATQERFEQAATWTERLRQLLAATARAEAARPLLTCPHLIAARRRVGGGWELVCVRWGALAGSMVTPPGADPRPYVETLRATARAVERPARVGSGASGEETALLAAWVLDDGARLVEVGSPQQIEGQPGSCSGNGAERAGDDEPKRAGQRDTGEQGTDPCQYLTWPIGAAARHQRVLAWRQ